MLLLTAISFVLSVMFIVVTFQYTAILKKRSCTCATKGPADEIMKALAIVQIIALVIALINLLLISFIVYMVTSNLRR
jgi:hypothetical protein